MSDSVPSGIVYVDRLAYGYYKLSRPGFVTPADRTNSTVMALQVNTIQTIWGCYSSPFPLYFWQRQAANLPTDLTDDPPLDPLNEKCKY
jgi:hypothetical protein